MKTTKLNVQGMHCKSCEMLLTDSLSEIDGITDVSVSVKDGTATVTHDGGVSEAQIRKTIEAEGYKTS